MTTDKDHAIFVLPWWTSSFVSLLALALRRLTPTVWPASHRFALLPLTLKPGLSADHL